MGSCVFFSGSQVTLKCKGQQNKKNKKKERNVFVGTMTVQLLRVIDFLPWCLLLSVYSPPRIRAYINQLKSKYKMTIDIYIVPAWFKESILKINAIQWLQFSEAFYNHSRVQTPSGEKKL